MINEQIRKALDRYGEDEGESFILLDNPSFDNSIIGISGNRLIYNYDKMIEEFAEDEQCDEIEAQEFIDYNTIRAIPYMGDGAPIISYGIQSIIDEY